MKMEELLPLREFQYTLNQTKYTWQSKYLIQVKSFKNTLKKITIIQIILFSKNIPQTDQEAYLYLP